jgi:dihydroflavonol-4-reductase
LINDRSYIVTGGTGFIGSHLAEEARGRGSRVRVLGLTDRPEEQRNAARLERLGIQVVSGSVTDADTVRRALEGFTHIYHLAVAMREGGESDSYFERINLDGTRNVLDAAIANRVERFIFCSTIGIFGHRAPGITDESSRLAPDNIYERSKMLAEAMVRRYIGERGLKAVILRPADVYGPRDNRLLKLFRAVCAGKFPLFGDGSGRRHMVYVDDVVAAFHMACETDAAIGQALIIAGPEVCSLRELIDLISRSCGRTKFGYRLPLKPMLLAAAATEDVCRIVGVSPPLYRRRMDFFRSDSAFAISRAKNVLGWKPKVRLEEGVRRTLDAYRKDGLL